MLEDLNPHGQTYYGRAEQGSIPWKWVGFPLAGWQSRNSPGWTWNPNFVQPWDVATTNGDKITKTWGNFTSIHRIPPSILSLSQDGPKPDPASHQSLSNPSWISQNHRISTRPSSLPVSVPCFGSLFQENRTPSWNLMLQQLSGVLACFNPVSGAFQRGLRIPSALPGSSQQPDLPRPSPEMF